MIKAIIFDLGNVVLTNDWHDGIKEKLKEFSDNFNISEDDMEVGWSKNWSRYKVGAFSEGVFWERFLKDSGANKIDVERCKAIYRKYQKPINNLFGLIKDLKKRYKIFALANVGKEWLEFKIDKFNLNKYFEMIVGSAHVGFAKPDHKIYELLLDKAKVKPEECIFIDDTERNLETARELGFKTIHFKNAEQLKQEIKRFGVKL